MSDITSKKVIIGAMMVFPLRSSMYEWSGLLSESVSGDASLAVATDTETDEVNKCDHK